MLAGIMAGAICNVALYFQYYRFAPSEFVLGWPYLIQAAILPRWMPEAVTIVCVITIFSFGWIAARWSWARTWQSSILAGAGSGTIAGCMMYAIVGLFWFGIKGQADVLGNFYNSMAEIDGLLIIVEAIFRTGTFVYAYFIQFVPACIALGTLGGLTSALLDANDVWGKHPNHSHGWLFRLPAYLLVICGILNLIVTVAILSLLWDKTMSSVKELAAENMRSELGTGYGFFLHWGYLTGLVFTFLPAGLTWGWIIRAWRHHGKLNFFSVIWLISTIVGAGYYMFKTTGLVDLMLGTEMLPTFCPHHAIDSYHGFDPRFFSWSHGRALNRRRPTPFTLRQTGVYRFVWNSRRHPDHHGRACNGNSNRPHHSHEHTAFGFSRDC